MEAKALIEGQDRQHYNRERPRSALGYRIPAALRAFVRVGRCGCGTYEGATIANRTLIGTDTENGGQVIGWYHVLHGEGRES